MYHKYLTNLTCTRNKLIGWDLGVNWVGSGNDSDTKFYDNELINCAVPFPTWGATPGVETLTTNKGNYFSLLYPAGGSKKYFVGNGSGTTFDIVHDLYTQDLRATAKNAATGAALAMTFTFISDTTIRVVFSAAPATNNAIVIIRE